MLTSILLLFLLFLSLAGWGMFFLYKIKVHPAFIPLFLFSGVTTVLFGAGLLHRMSLAANIIYYSGFFLCLIYLVLFLFKKISYKPLLHPSLVFFSISALFVMLYMRGTLFLNYDDFSHWGLVVKEIVRLDGLPDASTLVTFQNYPPGSAVFIYYFLNLLGFHESLALMAQGFMTMAGFTVLFLISSWKKPWAVILPWVISFTLLLVNAKIFYSLLVDIILGSVALAVPLIAYYYRKDWKRLLLVNLPIVILLILLKDSGKIFLLFNGIAMLGILIASHREGIEKRIDKVIPYASLVLLLVLPLVVSLLWHTYTLQAYSESYGDNKFAITEDKLNDIQKSEEFLAGFDGMMLDAALNPLSSPHVMALLVVNLIALLFIVRMKRNTPNELVSSFLLLNLFYVLYMCSLYYMYVYLMPENEASRLAGFNRYQSTITVYVGGMLMTVVVYVWSNYVKSFKRVTGILLAVCFLIPYIGHLEVLVTRPEAHVERRGDVKEYSSVIKTSGVSEPMITYYSPGSADDGGYFSYLIRYEHLSKNYSFIKGAETEEKLSYLKEVLMKSDFLMVLDHDVYIHDVLSQYTEHEISEGVYRVKHEKDRFELVPVR
ncbi:hypothetical protein ACFQWC_16310 [Rossellomorea sp. GCM10028870]|uniref:hypothetical protein n=1 Tax=Rossellomorea sp. GCM10028870 TaxID=3273426 RepID=UPI003623B403